MAQTGVDPQEVDREIRARIYSEAMQAGTLPTITQVAGGLNLPVESVSASFERLAAGRVLVLQPDNGEILMANPFSAVPTPFLVEAGGVSYYGNCIWDALGIPAMLQQDARIVCSCSDCGSALEVQVVDGKVSGDAGLLHFAVPARQWWQDIVFT